MTRPLTLTKPRVLYVTPMLGYPAFGGPRLRTYNTLKALARCADVTLFATQQPDTLDRDAAREHLLTFCSDVIFPPPPLEPAGLGVRLRRLARRAIPRGVRWHLAPIASAARQSLAQALHGSRLAAADDAELTGPARDPEQVAALRRWIAINEPRLLWLGFGGISYDLIPLKYETGTPLVLETECVWSRFILRELPFAANGPRAAEILAAGRAKEEEERRGAPLVDVTTAVSDADADYFRALAPDPEKVMLLANVIDVDAYAVDAAPLGLQLPAFVFAGTFSLGTANVDAALWLLDDVMPRVWQQRPDAHVYLVGRSPAPAILARKSQNVHVTGEVPSIVPYMRACTATLVPLRWESGTRFKILEAFACRTPVVSTTLGAEGLDVEHGVHLLLADEAKAFANAMLSLAEDRAIAPRLVEPAYDLVRQRYDISSAERQIRAILARLGVSEPLAVS